MRQLPFGAHAPAKSQERNYQAQQGASFLFETRCRSRKWRCANEEIVIKCASKKFRGLLLGFAKEMELDTAKWFLLAAVWVMRRWGGGGGIKKEETGKNLVKNDANLLTNLLSSFWSDDETQVKAKNVRCLWTMVNLVRLSETQKRQWQNLRISCKHVLWLLQRFVLNISFQFLWLRWVCVSVKDIRFL